MSDWQLNTPVAFIIFNRPDTTERVFAEIARAKPPKLLVVADGPRATRQGEAEKCAATRAIVDRVDWNCEVLTNYSEVNLGCKNRVASGLDWVFEQVPEAIILEDDCLPHPTFFRYCEELLGRYRDDERIGQIGGVNFQFGRGRTDDSYYFSRYNHIWGWASWRRAWKNYDVSLTLWPLVREREALLDILGTQRQVKHWATIFQLCYDSKIDTWDYQWTFANMINHSLTILPNVNLISNIGFGENATHTTEDSQLANMAVVKMQFPLVHPAYVIRDARADLITDKLHDISLAEKILGKLRRVLGNISNGGNP